MGKKDAGSRYGKERGFSEVKGEAEAAVSQLGGFPKRDLTDEECERLADVVLAFCEQMCDVELYPYEQEFGWRIIFSLLREDADEITALFSRQSGKTETVAVVVDGCMVLLPVLAKALYWESRISKFKDGLWCGIYAPSYDLAGIMWKRMRTRMYSKHAKEVMLDPDIDIDLAREWENMTLPNGSYVDCGTASRQTAIEGKTYHLILLEETQDIDSQKIRASIHPMAAATAGTLVKIGTPNTAKSEFFESCRRNKRADVNAGRLRHRHRLHYEYDYTVAQQYNPRYRKYVEKERQRLHEDSDEFRMKYKLHWLLERGMFINSDLFEECGIKGLGEDISIDAPRDRHTRGRPLQIKFVRSPNVITFDPDEEGQVASIDVGKGNSTVITVARVFWNGAVPFGEELRYPIHVSNWLEIFGDDHEEQHPQILDFLKNYRLMTVIVDATGKGDPIYSRLAAELDKFNINVEPFIFSASSKDLGYKILLQEIHNRRITYPAGSRATRLIKWQRFYNQMVDLEKMWNGPRMVVRKALDDKNARDDYPDSLMMLCYLVNAAERTEVEQAPNPLIGREARWNVAETVKQVGAWFRRSADPTAFRKPRPSKGGKWV